MVAFPITPPLAGNKIRELWTVAITDVANNSAIATVDAMVDGSGTTTSVGFTETLTGVGTCGVAFVAPLSGRVLLTYGSNVSSSTTAAVYLSIYVRAGGVVGSGADVLAPNDRHACFHVGTVAATISKSYLLSGLTPGSTYNVRLVHKTTSGTGTYIYRYVQVTPVS